MKDKTIKSSMLMLAIKLTATLAATLSATAYAQRMCVFDPAGPAGEVSSLAKDYAATAKNWGITIETISSQSDQKVSRDYASGKCDIALMTTISVREYNSFVGTIDSFGAIPNYEVGRSVLKHFQSSPKVQPYLIQDGHEVIGILPSGLAYMVGKNHSVQTMGELAGKKLMSLDYDPSQIILIKKIGAIPVPVDEPVKLAIGLNNGLADFSSMTIALYKALEVNKGMGKEGSIARFPVKFVSASVIARPDKFPVGFGMHSRNYFMFKSAQMFKKAERAESSIPDSIWVNIPTADQESYFRIFRELRIELRKKKMYNPKALAIIKVLRCQSQALAFDCKGSAE